MTQVWEARETVGFIDEYCEQYRAVFSDVRSYEYFKWLHVGLISELPRKSLPAIARAVGEAGSQGFHHLLAEGDWSVEVLRAQRLALTRSALAGRSMVVCIDETGDRKKGQATDYVASQYIGNLGKVENGMVSVHAYGVVDQITFPLLFKVYKPQKRLLAGDAYHSKPELALQVLRAVLAEGFTVELVLADRLYGESGPFIAGLIQLELPFVVAVRDNHGIWLPRGQRLRMTRWRPFERTFADASTQTRYLCEVIYGQRRTIRYFFLTTDPVTLPPATTVLLMTNLKGNLRHSLGNHYGLRTWIEYGFKHLKNELGWADYRLTAYPAIERWWEMVSSAYLMVSLHTQAFHALASPLTPLTDSPVTRHPWWTTAPGWKATLNNLRLLIQPFIALAFLLPWLTVFPIDGLSQALRHLIACINGST